MKLNKWKLATIYAVVMSTFFVAGCKYFEKTKTIEDYCTKSITERNNEFNKKTKATFRVPEATISIEIKKCKQNYPDIEGSYKQASTIMQKCDSKSGAEFISCEHKYKDNSIDLP